MAKNRKLVQILADTADSDVANTPDLDLGPYVHTGVIELEGVWLFHDFGAGTDTDHTYDMKFQEAGTTVDSDFSDISGAAFTQGTTVTEDTINQISFTATKRYIRGYQVLGGTVVDSYVFLGVIAIPRYDT